MNREHAPLALPPLRPSTPCIVPPPAAESSDECALAEEPGRVLTTLMFADIVDSTARAATVGDRAWCGELGNFYALARRQLERFRGREIDTTGDCLFAMFDAPSRAVRCALAIARAVTAFGLEVRAGVHTGEVEVVGDKVSGIAVHIGARVIASASAGEVVVSNTVRDLSAGSGLRFNDRGTQALKGIPGLWSLYRAT